jgi:hypothetical protein
MLHRRQNVIDVFLRYHGFAISGGLRAYPMSNYNRPELAGDFNVTVSLHPEMTTQAGPRPRPVRQKRPQEWAILQS